MLSFMEAREGRYGPAAAYSIILFLFIVLVSFLFVKFLGADVINDEEVSAIRAQRKRQRSLHRKSPNRKVRTTVTSGDMP